MLDPEAEQAYQKRQSILLAQDHWKLAGKLAASDGKEGGSGSFSWHRIGGVTRMSFRGALGKGAWELESTAGQAVLQFADGREFRASSIAELVTAHMRAKVPVDALSWWVLGLARPNEWEQRELDQEGRITYLSQSGWNVEFSNYRLEKDVWLPGKLVARNQQNSVKLAISEWTLAQEAAAFD
ncbi:MAG TPA: lipoprotein insertase outer membrane protein LolB [Xanthomonadales bacterium]|nr:lipoprotein insertase outer membrane protein LolB [Xanthomonadales bacterium]